MTSRKPAPASGSFYPELIRYLGKRATEFDSITGDRKTGLSKIADYVRGRLVELKPSRITFICTHNSRRSQLAQIWAQVAAKYYGVFGVETFSGGTEVTAFNPRAVAALQRGGLRIVSSDPSATNPRYRVYHSDLSAPQVCFSKVYGDSPNPAGNYCAVMTCSQADEACPLVMGCNLRIPVRYEDPKVADDTEFETHHYDERSAQICREMLYMISQVQL